MGYVEEPKDVDLLIAGGKLTAEDRMLISAMIPRQRATKKAPRAKQAAPKRASVKRANRKVLTKAK